MPIAPIAGKAGGFEAEDGTNATGTQTRYQALKTRPGYTAACGPAQIVINHVYILEAIVPRGFGQLIYCRRWLSRFVRTCIRVDCLT
jgi:hypothetical protein